MKRRRYVQCPGQRGKWKHIHCQRVGRSLTTLAGYAIPGYCDYYSSRCHPHEQVMANEYLLYRWSCTRGSKGNLPDHPKYPLRAKKALPLPISLSWFLLEYPYWFLV